MSFSLILNKIPNARSLIHGGVKDEVLSINMVSLNVMEDWHIANSISLVGFYMKEKSKQLGLQLDNKIHCFTLLERYKSTFMLRVHCFFLHLIKTLIKTQSSQKYWPSLNCLRATHYQIMLLLFSTLRI